MMSTPFIISFLILQSILKYTEALYFFGGLALILLKIFVALEIRKCWKKRGKANTTKRRRLSSFGMGEGGGLFEDDKFEALLPQNSQDPLHSSHVQTSSKMK